MKVLSKFETFDVVATVKLLETIWTELKDCKPTKAEEKSWKMVVGIAMEVGLNILNIDLYSNLEVTQVAAYTSAINSSC